MTLGGIVSKTDPCLLVHVKDACPSTITWLHTQGMYPAPGLAPNPSSYIQGSPSSLWLLLRSSDLPRCHVSPSQDTPVLAAAVPLPGASQSPSAFCQTRPAPRRSPGSSAWCWCLRGAGAGGSPHPAHGASPCLEKCLTEAQVTAG